MTSIAARLLRVTWASDLLGRGHSLFGIIVAVNLQAAFLSPPVAMSAFYLKGVAPAHVTLNQIFAGMMPFMLIVILCLACIYIWFGMTLWLPEFLHGHEIRCDFGACSVI